MVIHNHEMVFVVRNVRGFNIKKKKRVAMRIAMENKVEILGVLEIKIRRTRQIPLRKFFNGKWKTL